jgi:hypothetical protein
VLDQNLLPATWSQASSTASNFFRQEMLKYCPALRLCANHWKVDTLATEIYSQWVRRRRDQVQKQSHLEPTNTKKKRKSEDELELDDVQKSRSKATKRTKPNSVNAITSTSKPIASTSRTTTTSRAPPATTISRALTGASSNPASSTPFSSNPTETEPDNEDVDGEEVEDDNIDLATAEEPTPRLKGKAKEREPKGKERERPEAPPIQVVNPLYVSLELPGGGSR